jgi:Glutaminase
MRSLINQLFNIAAVLSISLAANAFDTFGVSQARPARMSYKQSYRIATMKKLKLKYFATSEGTSAYESAKPFAEWNFSQVAEWKDLDEIEKSFQEVRDARFLNDPNLPEFRRRSTWLYPDDGCFARADLARANLIQWGHTEPNKIYIFGNLKVTTENSADGMVYWWYHVAPLVRIGEKVFVLDPALRANQPTPVREWVGLMADDVENTQIAICGGKSYDPHSACENATDSSQNAVFDQTNYLDSEWQRQIELGRDPLKVLGDNPPWSH